MLALTLACSLQLGALSPSLPAVALAQTPAPAPASAPSLAGREERHKSFNPLIGILELTVGAVAGYAGVLVGVLANIGQGGLSWPPDAGDVLLLGLLPAGLAAGGAWLVGLLDVSQRSVLGSLVHAFLGGVIGQAAGLGVGYLVGRSVAGPADDSGAMSIAVFVAPAFAALGSVVFMELFKPGAVSVSASVAPLRDAGGAVGLAPAVALTWERASRTHSARPPPATPAGGAAARTARAARAPAAKRLRHARRPGPQFRRSTRRPAGAPDAEPPLEGGRKPWPAPCAERRGRP